MTDLDDTGVCDRVCLCFQGAEGAAAAAHALSLPAEAYGNDVSLRHLLLHQSLCP